MYYNLETVSPLLALSEAGHDAFSERGFVSILRTWLLKLRLITPGVYILLLLTNGKIRNYIWTYGIFINVKSIDL